MRIVNLLILCIIFFATQNLLAASKYKFDSKAGKTVFETKGWPSLIVIKGEGLGAKGELIEDQKTLSGELIVDLTSLKTGIDLRDNHMKDKYLQVKDFPTAKLTITKMPIPEKLSGEVKFSGEMEVHGVTKKIEGMATLSSSENGVTVKAEFPLKLSDYKIEIPSYKGITVAEKVKVKFESSVVKTM